jgi:[amino group carrier protein]-L-2-aminoadipate 6-kinase
MLIVKIGGGETINLDAFCADVAKLSESQEIIIVHGASVKRDEVAQKLATPTRYLTSPSGHVGVYTDQQAIEVMTMVYSGLINKQLVSKLQKAGVNAVGLTGADGQIWQGRRKKNLISVESGRQKLITDTYTGKVEIVNSALLKSLTQQGYVPVITQPAISFEGDLINTDNDRNIAVMAHDLKVDKLVVLFEAPGLLRDVTDESSLISKVDKNMIDDVMQQVSGRMRKKALGAKEAFALGVKEILWSDARVEQPITKALAGSGTTIS